MQSEFFFTRWLLNVSSKVFFFFGSTKSSVIMFTPGSQKTIFAFEDLILQRHETKTETYNEWQRS